MTEPRTPPRSPSRRRHWALIAILVLIGVASVARSGTWLLIGLLLLAAYVVPWLIQRALYSVGAKLRILYLLTGVLPGVMVALITYYGAHAVLGQVSAGVIERRIEHWTLDIERRLAQAEAHYWRARSHGAGPAEAAQRALETASPDAPALGRSLWASTRAAGTIATAGSARAVARATPSWLEDRRHFGLARLDSATLELRGRIRIDDGEGVLDLWCAQPLDERVLEAEPEPPLDDDTRRSEFTANDPKLDSAAVASPADTSSFRARAQRAGRRGLDWFERGVDRFAREREIVAYHGEGSGLLVTVIPWSMRPSATDASTVWLTRWGPPLPPWGEREADPADPPPAEYTALRERIVSPLPALTWSYRRSVVDWRDGRSDEDVLLFLAFSIEAAAFALFGDGLPPIVWISLIAAIVILTLLQTLAENAGFRFARRIADAVSDLDRGVKQIREGRFGHRIEPRDQDQLGALARGFNEMSAQLGELVEERSARQALEHELEIARRVQARLFPASAPITAELEACGVCLPARTVSGDYYDFIERPGGYDVVVADVSGKGVAAAFLMANVHAVLRSLYAGTASEATPEPSELITALNRHVGKHAESDRFVTLFLLRYLGGGELLYASGGHNPPALVRKGRVRWLEAGGPLLGPVHDARYETVRVAVEPGDTIVLYTDGVIDAESPRREPFGDDRLVEQLERLSGRPPGEIQAGVLDALERWREGTELNDDVTVVVVSIRR